MDKIIIVEVNNQNTWEWFGTFTITSDEEKARLKTWRNFVEYLDSDEPVENWEENTRVFEQYISEIK